MARAVSSDRKCPVGVSIDRAVSFALIVSAVNAKWPGELHKEFARIGAKYALVRTRRDFDLENEIGDQLRGSSFLGSGRMLTDESARPWATRDSYCRQG